MLQPQNQTQKYEYLFNRIDDGTIKIPKFQREFVWSKEQTAKLIDSIIKGFPIGTFIYWKTREELRHIKEVGNAKLPDIPKGDAAFYVLDGQQRMTSLYAVRKGLIIDRDGKELHYKDITINLDYDPDDDEQVVNVEPPLDSPYISVHELLTVSPIELMDDYDREQLQKIQTYRDRLTGYGFPVIIIEDYPIDIACEVFTRINTGGTELTLFEIMVAKTYDVDRDFDLAREYELLIDNNGTGKDLEDAGYETIPASTILQCIAAHLRQDVRRKDILKLEKSAVIDNWSEIKSGIFDAVDYFSSHLRIPVSRLLPYNALLVPFTYFFIRNQGNPPNSLQNKLLIQYFWWASLSSRFTSAVESKLAADLKRIDSILVSKPPEYRSDEEIELDLDDLMWRWFSTGDAFCKAILCLYTYFQPRSFASDALVKVDNSWLKVANSKNYHHFFPKNFIKKRPEYEDWEANVILNITIVDDYLNKRSIRAKAPSKYMQEFAQNNPDLEETMKTHLIGDLKQFGIFGAFNKDDYHKFLEQRGTRVLKELNKRLKPKIPAQTRN